MPSKVACELFCSHPTQPLDYSSFPYKESNGPKAPKATAPPLKQSVTDMLCDYNQTHTSPNIFVFILILILYYI